VHEPTAEPSASSPTSTAPRELLRAGTRELHARLDEMTAGLELADRSDYAAFLSASAAALLPLERHLERNSIELWVPDWSRRRRSAAITSDLTRLGARGEPRMLRDPPVEPAALLGMAYVLEGSRLGARVLIGRVAASADPDVRAATAYLGHGASEGLWRSFLPLLAVGPEQVPGLLAGARFAFATFIEAMVGLGSRRAAE
jgi:heme oxygenase (biliverdin-IX-beta and delta-forming)